MTNAFKDRRAHNLRLQADREYPDWLGKCSLVAARVCVLWLAKLQSRPGGFFSVPTDHEETDQVVLFHVTLRRESWALLLVGEGRQREVLIHDDMSSNFRPLHCLLAELAPEALLGTADRPVYELEVEVRCGSEMEVSLFLKAASLVPKPVKKRKCKTRDEEEVCYVEGSSEEEARHDEEEAEPAPAKKRKGKKRDKEEKETHGCYAEGSAEEGRDDEEEAERLEALDASGSEVESLVTSADNGVESVAEDAPNQAEAEVDDGEEEERVGQAQHAAFGTCVVWSDGYFTLSDKPTVARCQGACVASVGNSTVHGGLKQVEGCDACTLRRAQG